MTTERRADLVLILIVVIWGSTFTVVKQAIADCPVSLFLALRFTVGTLALLPVFGRRLEAGPGVLGGVLAGLCLAAGYGFQTLGLLTTSASKSAFLTGLNVVLVPLFGSFVYRKVPRLREAVGIVLAVVGMSFMTLEGLGDGAQPWRIGSGDLLTVGAAVAFAFHPLVIARFAHGSAATVSFVQIATAMVLTWAASAADGSASIASIVRVWRPGLAFALAVTGVLATAFVFSAQTWVQRHAPANRVALFFALEPAVGALTAFLVLDERLTMQAIAGALMILAGIVVSELKPARTK